MIEAKDFAYKAHEGQTRKGKQTPFVEHLYLAVNIAQEITSDKDIIDGVWLHDTVEDTSVTLEDIKENFNERVYNFVLLETEEKEKNAEESWKRRKVKQITELKKHISNDVIIITFSDKMANLLELLEDYQKEGDEVFNKFNNKNKADHFWYYNEFFLIFSNSNKIPYKSLEKYKKTLDKIFN